MGTDIHIQVQVNDGSGWRYTRNSPFPRYGEPGFNWADDPTGRNYDLFALLAGVRNGVGFAGVYRHEPVTPYFEGRGLPAGATDCAGLEIRWCNGCGPDDCSGCREWSSGLDGGDTYIGEHSFTHASLAELRAVDWSTEFNSGGVASVEQFNARDGAGMPSSWCGDISGPGIVIHEDPEAFARLVESGLATGRDYVRLRWSHRPLEKCAFRRWLDGAAMQALADEYGAENVRLLIGFDS